MFIFIRIVNTIVTEIRMSNFYHVRKLNHFFGHQLPVNVEFFKLMVTRSSLEQEV